MTTKNNPFLDPKRDIVQGKSDEQLREALERPPEEDTSPAPGQRSSFSNDDYVFIPLEALSAVELPEYVWFREDGIYVAKGKLLVDDTVRAASNKLRFDLGSATDGDLVTPTWYEAKWLAAALGGEMLTPAMLFCVIEHLKATGSDFEMLQDITRKDAEWLDAIVDLSCGLDWTGAYTRTMVKNDKGIWSWKQGEELWCDGYDVLVPADETVPDDFYLHEGWFGSDDIERGFPERLHISSKEHWYYPPSESSREVAVARTIARYGDMALSPPNKPALDLRHSPWYRDDRLGMRLCFTAEQYNRMTRPPLPEPEKKARKRTPRVTNPVYETRKMGSEDGYTPSWPPPIGF